MMMEERNPFIAFDWYFADVSKRDAARYHAIKDKPKETSVLMDLVSANVLIHFALWNELPKAHPVGELWLETETDLIATIYLAYGGFFRQALVVLRAWFEIAIHSVYFSNHYSQPSSRYRQWRCGKRNAPASIHKLAEALASRRDMIFKADKAIIQEKLEPIYSFLSEQTHARGLDVYNLQEGRDNVPRYLSRNFDIWYEKVLEAFDALCFLYRIFFMREIASYFKYSEIEMQHACALAESLSGVMPDFGCLMTDVFSGRMSPDES
jgi:hypothetical protein